MKEILSQLRNYIKITVSKQEDVTHMYRLIDELKNKFENDIIVTYQANRLLNELQKNIKSKDNEQGEPINFLPIESKTIIHQLASQFKQKKDSLRRFSPWIRGGIDKNRPKSKDHKREVKENYGEKGKQSNNRLLLR